MPRALATSAIFDLSAKVAVVTGAGGGLGRAIAVALARHGAALMICGRRSGPLMELAAELGAQGAQVAWSAADVSDEDQVAALKEAALRRFGRVDVLINNAGANPSYGTLQTTELYQWRATMDANLTSAFLCCRSFGPEMFENGGSIVNVGSIAGRVGMKHREAYSAAKGGIEAFTRSLAVSWSSHNVRVNCLVPGFFETDLTQAIWSNPAVLAAYSSKTLMGRLGESAEIVGAALFLASPASSYVTGHSLVIDGGWTVQ